MTRTTTSISEAAQPRPRPRPRRRRRRAARSPSSKIFPPELQEWSIQQALSIAFVSSERAIERAIRGEGSSQPQPPSWSGLVGSVPFPQGRGPRTEVRAAAGFCSCETRSAAAHAYNNNNSDDACLQRRRGNRKKIPKEVGANCTDQLPPHPPLPTPRPALRLGSRDRMSCDHRGAGRDRDEMDFL